MLTYHTKFPAAAAIICQPFWKLVITSIIGIIVAIAIQSDGNVARAEYFSSMDSIQKLSGVEKGLVKAFRFYLEAQESELESYKRFIENIKLQHTIALEDVEDYLGNPVNAFTLIKRMVADWNNLNQFMKESLARKAFQEMLEKVNQEQKIPDDTDLNGAIMGLVRLQRAYNLSASDLAYGQVKDVYTGNELTWNECFEMATNLFDQKEFPLAISWFEIVLEKLYDIEGSKEVDPLRRFELDTLEYLALSNYALGNSEKAVEYIDEILTLAPNHHTKDLHFYVMNNAPKQQFTPSSTDFYTANPNYTRLCRGIQVPQKDLQNLMCTLETRGSPYFVLAPLKVEQLSRDPEIKVYHGLLTDVQIVQILDQAKGNMVRSRVESSIAPVVSDVRVSQQTWLNYKSPAMRSAYHLVSQITGLDLANSESMQVANYGIGGQYEQHTDFFPDEYTDERFMGNRMMTNVFYLSDVKQGGFTVFPHINIYSRPVKGSMVSWYNLHRSLDPDYRTLHAGCPVVTGSKRIGNIWIHAGLQEFRRPCGLDNDSYKSVAFYKKKNSKLLF